MSAWNTVYVTAMTSSIFVFFMYFFGLIIELLLNSLDSFTYSFSKFSKKLLQIVFLPNPYLSSPLLSILTAVMWYTACRFTLHLGFVSFSPVCVQKSSFRSVPLLPSTAPSATLFSKVDDCTAVLLIAMSNSTVNHK